MIGCKSLSDLEIESMLSHLSVRDQALFILGLRTGFRISELLSLRVKDVLSFGKISDRITIQKKNMKGKHSSRNIVLHTVAKNALRALLDVSRGNEEDYLFRSREGYNEPLSRFQAYKVLRAAADICEIQGKIGTHSMRKSFAIRVYEKLGRDLVKTQRALGHKSIASTVSYLSCDQEDIDEAISS